MELSFNIIRDSETGVINVEQSLRNARQVVEQYKAKRETEEADIAVAVELAFDKFPQSLQNRKAVISDAISTMHTPPSAWVDMEKRIGAYLTENIDHPADEENGVPAEKPRTRLFGRRMGPKGGLFAWKNVPQS